MGSLERPGREAWLDGLKGFGILLVVLGHVLSGYLDAGAYPEAVWSFYRLRSWIYSFHMPLFFLLSGFTFTLAYWRDGKLRRSGYAAQLVNLLWIYVLFALLQWGVKQVVPQMVNETYSLEDLKRMFVEPLGNFWYIYVLLVLYLLAALVRLPDREPQWLLLLGGAAIVAADIHLDWTQLTLYRILYHLFFFALGSALCTHRKYLSSEKLLGVSAMVLATAAYFYFCWGARNWFANWKVAIAVTTCYVNVWLFFRFRPLAEFPLFQWCGRYCLEIYLLHTFFTAGLRNLLLGLDAVGPWCSVWVNFILSTALSLGIAVFAGRHPWTDAIFRPSRFLRRRKKAE